MARLLEHTLTLVHPVSVRLRGSSVSTGFRRRNGKICAISFTVDPGLASRMLTRALTAVGRDLSANKSVDNGGNGVRDRETNKRASSRPDCSIKMRMMLSMDVAELKYYVESGNRSARLKV